MNFNVDPVSGYTAIEIADAGLSDGIESGDISIGNSNTCGLAVCNLADLDFIKDIFISTIEDTLIGTLDDMMGEFEWPFVGPMNMVGPSGATDRRALNFAAHQREVDGRPSLVVGRPRRVRL